MSWVGDEVGYFGAHTRVKSARGSASKYRCTRCGGKAHAWAYDHTDPNERFEYMAHWDREVAYSPNVGHYHPLCRGCHVRVDRYGYDLTPNGGSNVPDSQGNKELPPGVGTAQGQREGVGQDVMSVPR